MAQIPLATAASVEQVVRKYGPYTINFDTPNLETGADLFDPPVGATIKDVITIPVVLFSGNAVAPDYVQVITDGTDESLTLSSDGYALDPSVGPLPDGDKLSDLAPYSTLAQVVTHDGTLTLPRSVDSACTLRVKVPILSGGPATAGQFLVYVELSEPAS